MLLWYFLWFPFHPDLTSLLSCWPAGCPHLPQPRKAPHQGRVCSSAWPWRVSEAPPAASSFDLPTRAGHLPGMSPRSRETGASWVGKKTEVTPVTPFRRIGIIPGWDGILKTNETYWNHHAVTLQGTPWGSLWVKSRKSVDCRSPVSGHWILQCRDPLIAENTSISMGPLTAPWSNASASYSSMWRNDDLPARYSKGHLKKWTQLWSWNVLDGFTGLPQPTFFNVGLIRLSQALVIGVCGGDSPFMLFDHINYKMSPKYVKCYNTAITPAKQLYYL